MASTFSSAQHFVGPISDNYRIGIQCGQSTGSSAPALAEMKWITMEEFKTYARQGLGNMANYRGAYSDALPENAVQNDYFNATGTFTVSGVTYTSGHVYEYNGSTWGDVTGIFAQFCTLQQAIAAAQSQINELALLKTQLAQALSSDEDKVPSNKCVNDAINAIIPSIVYTGTEVGTGYTVTKKGIYMATFYAQVSGVSAVGRHDISILKNAGGVTTYLSSDSIASGANYPCASCSCIVELEPLNQIVFGSYNPNDNPYLSLRTVVAFIGQVN